MAGIILNILIAVVVKVLEKVIPEMLTRKKEWTWGKERKRKIIHRLKGRQNGKH